MPPDTHTNADFQNAEYWETRYKTEDSFEWCCYVSQWSHLLEEVVPKDWKLLVLGCGNSSMSADLYKLGYERIVNVDYSPAVIQKMAEKYASMHGMEWHTMDMFDLTFREASFDCVIEKCALEILFVKEKDPWNPSEQATELLQKVMNQVSKVLRPGGLFISVSFTQPHFRMPLLKTVCVDWVCRYKTFGETFHYFFYLCAKVQVDADSKEPENRPV